MLIIPDFALRQWLDDVKERTGLSLNEMWREPDDCVDGRNRVRRVGPKN